MRRDVFDFEGHDIASSKLAIDRQIEECEIPLLIFELQLRPYRPDVSRLERGLLAYQFAFVPRFPSSAREMVFLHRPSPLFVKKRRDWPLDDFVRLGMSAFGAKRKVLGLSGGVSRLLMTRSGLGIWHREAVNGMIDISES